MTNAMSLLIGWLLDLVFGDPARLPHPIVWFGKAIAFFEHRLNKGSLRKAKGAVTAIILIIGIFCRRRYHTNYFTLIGLIAGANTAAPLLGFANEIANNDAPAVGYSTVYPLTMFLRILTAQLIILFLCV